MVSRPKQRTGCATLSVLLVGIALTLVGCAYPENYQEWQWRQYNPEWKSLPGGPDR